MIVVDSSVWIAHLRGLDIEPVRKFQWIENLDEVLIGDLILLEILQGARDEPHAIRMEQELRRFTIEPMLDDALAARAARNYRLLRGHGVSVRKTIDIIIATFCIERGHVLLHHDRDFDAMAPRLGLQVL